MRVSEAFLRNSRAETSPTSSRSASFTRATTYHRADSERVIFLDIDGVLNRSSGGTAKDHTVAMDLLNRFKSLLSSTNARVVLASTWRHEPNGLQKARDLGIPFDDVLPDLRPQPRGREVNAWLADHPNVKRFAVVDDDDDEYEDLPLFQPNPRIGLSPDVAAAVEEYFSGRRDNDCRRAWWVRAFEYLKSFFEGHRG
jgi:hypothetical protein